MDKFKVSFMSLLLMLMAVIPAAAASAKPVKFTEVKRYFHNNDAPLPKNVLITTQADFDSQFSPAAVMGKDGQPTVLDFKRQAVLAIVLPETDKAAEIKDVKLVSTGKNQLQLSYTAEYGARHGYTTQPVYLMAIDGKYRTSNVSVKANVVEEPETIVTDYRNAHYINNPRHIDLSIDYPVQTFNGLKASVQSYESEALSKMVGAFTYKDNTKDPVYGENDCDFDKMLNFYTAQLVDSMNAIDKENAAPDRPCSAQLNIIRTDDTNQYLTLETRGYSYMGGANGLSIDGGVTFNKATGKRADIVKASDDLTKLIATRLPAEVRDYLEVNPLPMPQTPAFLNDGKVVFLYQTGEIAANAAGTLKVEFWPYEVEKYLTAEGKALTDLNY